MNDNAESGAHPIASGVEALIKRLREEGVSKGQTRAQEIISEAEARAQWIVSQAREEAERIVERAHAEQARSQNAAREAMRVAARDALLSVQSDLTQQFARRVVRLVSDTLSSEEMLQKMILEVVGRTRREIDEREAAEVILPSHVVAVDELRRDASELRDGSLSHFVLAQATEMVREGVTFGVAEDDQKGLRIGIRDGEVTLDLTERAVAELLLAHLQPRFRALLEGIVR